MRILYTSDTHVHPAHFSRLLHAAEEILPDAVIVGGDINPNWRRAIGASIEPHKSWIRDRLLPKVSAFAESILGFPCCSISEMMTSQLPEACFGNGMERSCTSFTGEL